LVAQIINERLAPLVLGEDLTGIERIWDRMYRSVYEPRMPVAVRLAISSVDIALWDILGKTAGIPVYKLLGGFRDKVPAYASGGYYGESKGVEDLIKEAAGYVQDGFRAVKIKTGRLKPEEDVARIRAVRNAVGDDVDIMVDANCAWNSRTAVNIAGDLEKLNISWLEEPVPPQDHAGLAHIRRSTNIRIATGEQEFSRQSIKMLLENDAVDILQVDATVCGGLTEWRKIAALAQTYGVLMAPHAEAQVHIHAVASVPNGLTVEYFPNPTRDPLASDLYLHPVDITRGHISLPSTPGLGISLNTATIERYRSS